MQDPVYAMKCGSSSCDWPPIGSNQSMETSHTLNGISGMAASGATWEWSLLETRSTLAHSVGASGLPLRALTKRQKQCHDQFTIMAGESALLAGATSHEITAIATLLIHIADCAHSKAARARLEVEALILQLAHAFSTFRPLDLPLLPQSRLKASSASLKDSFECVAAAAQEAAGRLLDAVLGVFERASHQQAPEQEQPDASPAVASLQQISALHNFRLRLQDAVGQVWLQEARQDKHSCTGQPMHKHCLQPSASSHHTHIPHPSRTSFGGSHILSTNGTIAEADRPRSVHHPQMLSATGQAFAARSEEGRNYSDPASFTISSQLCALIANSGRDSLVSGATSMCLTPQTAASSASEQRMTLGHISGPSSASGSASPSTGGTHLLRSVVPVKAQNMFSRPHTYTHTHMHQLSASHQHLVFGIGTSRLSSQSGDASLGCHSQSRSNVSSAHEVAMQLAPRSWAGPASATHMQSAIDKGMIMGGRASVGGLLPGRAMHGGVIGSSTFTRSSLSGSDGCTALTHGPAAHSTSTSAGMHVHALAVPGQAPVAPGPAAAAAAGLAFMRRSFWHGSQRGKPKTPAKLHRSVLEKNERVQYEARHTRPGNPDAKQAAAAQARARSLTTSSGARLSALNPQQLQALLATVSVTVGTGTCPGRVTPWQVAHKSRRGQGCEVEHNSGTRSSSSSICASDSLHPDAHTAVAGMRRRGSATHPASPAANKAGPSLTSLQAPFVSAAAARRASASETARTAYTGMLACSKEGLQRAGSCGTASLPLQAFANGQATRANANAAARSHLAGSSSPSASLAEVHVAQIASGPLGLAERGAFSNVSSSSMVQDEHPVRHSDVIHEGNVSASWTGAAVSHRGSAARKGSEVSYAAILLEPVIHGTVNQAVVPASLARASTRLAYEAHCEQIHSSCSVQPETLGGSFTTAAVTSAHARSRTRSMDAAGGALPAGPQQLWHKQPVSMQQDEDVWNGTTAPGCAGRLCVIM